MSVKVKAAILTLVVGLPAFVLGQVIWPNNPMSPAPTPGQLPFFIFLSALEALLFGLGIAFVVWGRPKFGKNWLAFVALTWLLVSWWPHDNMHRSNGMNLQGLLVIEYLFHFTLIVASLILTHFFLTKIRKET